MKKYIITEEQLKKIAHFQKMNESITSSPDGKLLINNHKYEVSVGGIGNVDIDMVKQMSDGNFEITASKGFLSKKVLLQKERAEEILNQIPKSEITSKGKTTFTLKKV